MSRSPSFRFPLIMLGLALVDVQLQITQRLVMQHTTQRGHQTVDGQRGADRAFTAGQICADQLLAQHGIEPRMAGPAQCQMPLQGQPFPAHGLQRGQCG